MKKFRLLTLLLLVLSISLIFIACNNADKNTEAPTPPLTEAPTQKPTEAPTQKPTEAPTETPTQNNTEHTHIFSNSTCTTPKTCECGATEGSPKGHSYVETVKAPTCTQAGFTTHTCECGVTYSDHTIDALGHNFENGTCKVCGDADHDYMPPHSHSYTSVVTNPACTTDGYTTHTCDCGDSYTDTPVGALGHTFDNGACRVCGDADPDYVPTHSHSYTSVVTNPTCTADGYTTHTCNCGDSYTDTPVGALGHTFENGVCGTCGAADPDYEPPVISTNKADFDTIQTGTNSGGDANYTQHFTTDDGWTTVNSAIQVGGSAVANPAFPIIGPDNSSKAVCLNGKTSAPGKLTSPTLNGGISVLNICYTKMFTDTKLSITITVTELSTGSKYTQTISKTADKNDKYTVWEYEWVLETPVVGDFIIEVVNNCPSGVDSNKDRFTILSLTWKSLSEGGNTHACTHKNTTTNTVQATCTKDGSTTVVCNDCGKTVSTTPISATGHNYVDGTCSCGEKDPGYAEGDDDITKESFKADLASLNKNTTYDTYTTTDQMWSVKNGQILQGGTADDSNKGIYKAIGDSAARAMVMNGKTTAKGVITSATISGGISSISFNYANFYKENNGVDITVTIKQNGVEIATKKLDNDSVTQNIAYTFTWDLEAEGNAATGDFTIEITNNSPSNNTGNKDRVAVWNIQWTNNPVA